MRDAIYNELGYRASAGISHNKSCAKIASSQNKPNAQTVVPERYMIKALAPIMIKSMRFCGGKISEVL
jgi:DNA polymerase-4